MQQLILHVISFVRGRNHSVPTMLLDLRNELATNDFNDQIEILLKRYPINKPSILNRSVKLNHMKITT